MTEGRRPALDRRSVLPAVSPVALARLPLHVLVADYPEVLGRLRGRGVDPADQGGLPAENALGGELVAEVGEWISWRGEASSFDVGGA